MNTITYKGQTLLEGPQNFFKLSTGVRPSFGFFRASSEAVDFFWGDRESSGDLIFEDENDLVVIPNVWLVKAEVMETDEEEYSESDIGEVRAIWDITLADERIIWPFTYCTHDYNTYKAERLGASDYDLENLHSSNEASDSSGSETVIHDEWTFQQIIDNLADYLNSDFGELPFAIIRKPRNLIADGLPVPNVLQKLLNDIGCYLAVIPEGETEGSSSAGSSSSGAPSYYYVIKQIGGAEDADELAILETLVSSRLYKGWNKILVNEKVQRSSTAEMLAAADPSVNDGDRIKDYGDAITIGGTGAYKVPVSYAANEENSDALEVIGDEVANQYKNSFKNIWRDVTLIGIHNLEHNSIIQEITWQSTSHGAYTRIRSFRPREKCLDGAKNGLFNYGDYPVNKSGRTQLFKLVKGPEGIADIYTGRKQRRITGTTTENTGDTNNYKIYFENIEGELPSANSSESSSVSGSADTAGRISGLIVKAYYEGLDGDGNEIWIVHSEGPWTLDLAAEPSSSEICSAA